MSHICSTYGIFNMSQHLNWFIFGLNLGTSSLAASAASARNPTTEGSPSRPVLLAKGGNSSWSTESPLGEWSFHRSFTMVS